jgi:ElaB/YqjD/DUF883 family membrane-anchored ribosome-binding protein
MVFGTQGPELVSGGGGGSGGSTSGSGSTSQEKNNEYSNRTENATETTTTDTSGDPFEDAQFGADVVENAVEMGADPADALSLSGTAAFHRSKQIASQRAQNVVPDAPEFDIPWRNVGIAVAALVGIAFIGGD